MLIELEFSSLMSDSCVRIYPNHFTRVVVTLYVDELFISGCDITVNTGIKEVLIQLLKLCELRNMSPFLSIHGTRDRPKRTLAIS